MREQLYFSLIFINTRKFLLRKFPDRLYAYMLNRNVPVATQLHRSQIVGGHQNIFKDINYCAAINQAAAYYYKLTLVVGRSGSGKTNLLKKICEQMHIPLINLGFYLSQKLLPLTLHERKLKAADIIADILDAQGPHHLAVDNTEVIFDPSLMLNPLGLLQSLSRTRLLIWSWNGVVEDGYVTYAHRGHPEYQRIPTSEIILITL